MGKQSTPRQKRGLLPLMGSEADRTIPATRESRPFAPLNPAQARYASLIRSCELVFGVGPAGTGKTWCAMTIAAEGFQAGHWDRIVITRPIVEAGEELGFLPGTMEEKVAPYFRPARAVLEKRLGRGHVEALLKTGRIEFLPLAYMRGESIDNAIVVLDEAQNTTPTQMKMFLTRKGRGSTFVVDGDATQKDIPVASGLIDGIRKAAGLPGVGIQVFETADIVRDGLVQMLVERYAERDLEFERDLHQAINAHRQMALDMHP